MGHGSSQPPGWAGPRPEVWVRTWPADTGSPSMTLSGRPRRLAHGSRVGASAHSMLLGSRSSVTRPSDQHHHPLKQSQGRTERGGSRKFHKEK